MESFNLTAVGDLILARRMHMFYEQDSIEKIFGNTLQYLRNSDLNLCNLETVITHKGKLFPKREKNPYYFRCSVKLAQLLIDSNFHAVTTANNHAMDYGEEGVIFQKDFLDFMNIPNSGSGRNLAESKKPMYIRVKDSIVAVISFCTVNPKTLFATDERGGIFYISKIENISSTLEGIIKKAKEHADFIIVSPHWTENWVENPEEQLRVQARKLIDFGCDAILGHSSHLLLGMEVYKNKPIIYDMGTFLVDTIAGNEYLKYSAMFKLKFSNNQISQLDIYPTILHNGGVEMADEKCFSYVSEKLQSLDDNNLENLEISKDENNIKFIFEKERKRKKKKKDISIYDINDIKKDVSIYEKKYLFNANVATNSINAQLEYGYKILDYQAVESFRTGSGFLSKLTFQVGEKSFSNIEVNIVGKSKYGQSFSEIHPISNGAFNSIHWKKDDIVVDEVCLRINRRVQPGVYQLYCALIDTKTNEYIKTVDGKEFVELSEIYILPELVSNLASGIDWDGKLKEQVKRKFEDEFMNEPERYLLEGIRKEFIDGNKFDKNFALRAFEQKYKFNSSLSLIYLTLFQDKKGSTKWGSRRKELKLALLRDIEKIQSKRNFSKFDLEDENCGILFEMVVEKTDISVDELLKEEILFDENKLGYEFQFDDKVDVLVTEAECKYFNLYTNRQKIVFSLIKYGITEFDDLETFLRENYEKIVYRKVKTVALVNYQGKTNGYVTFKDIDSIIFS
ncbi:CapA family protein [Halarcobacter sp.]|uniref:CapA family protein n=1 Tax=Halarcobacter sp. TaxID=2321133 RepID=UPI0029F57BB9|nr:CapA family protein [Halarcobacter sp.]